jgi:hypothetical protein
MSFPKFLLILLAGNLIFFTGFPYLPSPSPPVLSLAQDSVKPAASTVTQDTYTPARLRAQKFLAQAQQADGGWGYNLAGPSFTEPTAWALLALRSGNHQSISVKGQSFITANQNPDGGWGPFSRTPSQPWSTALVLLTQPYNPDNKGYPWLLARRDGLTNLTEAQKKTIRENMKLDVNLRGWPWYTSTSEWVEPTAYGLWALSRHNAPEAQERRRQALLYLADRACKSGGWNFGNPYMVEVWMEGYLDTTAVVLVALNQVPEKIHPPITRKAVSFLKQETAATASPISLAWSLWALSYYSQEKAFCRQLSLRLLAAQKDNGSWEDSPYITAVAVSALKNYLGKQKE